MPPGQLQQGLEGILYEKFYPPIMLISVNRLFPHELKQLGIIIKNHSLNPNEPVSRLFDYIAALYPKIEEKDITPEVIHKKIFRGSIFDRQKVWKVITIFNRFVEKLLIESELEIDESLSNLLLKRAMRKRKFRGRFYSIKSRNHKDIFDKFVTDTGTYANSSTIIKYEIRKSSKINISLFDLSGRKLKKLVNAFYNAESYQLLFEASELASGIYLYSLYADYILINSSKLTLIK